MATGKPLGNMIVKLDLDSSAFSKGLAGAKNAVNHQTKAMKAQMQIMNSSGNSLGALQSKYSGLSGIIEANEKQVELLNQAYKDSFDASGNATASTTKYANQLNQAQARSASYEAQMKETAGQMARLKVETEGATGWLKQHGDAYIESGKKIQSYGDKVSSAGTALTLGVTAPILAGAAAVTKAAMTWESDFAGVKKTNDEVVNSNGQVVYSYSDLENGLRKLTTQLPSTHTEIASVAEAAGQLGIKTEDVVGFTKTMIDMGESTNLSAEDAATAIAKIANITGLTADEYQRFGSSVVALGNNFATTENDIVMMANRLASAGTLAGLTNQEILGLATSMSSVGIEAEAGGTAMTQTLSAIEKAALNGGETLQQFAKLAGVSSEEFATMWKEKPIKAVQAFIQGLGKLDEQGESATIVLDEMGLSGIRQSNMLKSLALASDTMTSAVKMSNTAWKENTALTDEASTRYETTESKLAMLKNEIYNTAIDLGGPLVDALRDGLKASKPLLKNLGDLAKAFSNLDQEQQQNIMKWIAIAAGIGPVTKGLGGVIKVTGKTRSAIGVLNNSVVDLMAKAAEKRAMASFTSSLTVAGTAASTTAGASGIAGLGASIAALAGPIGIGVASVAAITGVIGLGYGAWKTFGEEALNSSQRVKQWGTDVGAITDITLDKVQSNTQSASGQFNLMAQGLNTDTDAMVQNFEQIGQTLEQSLINKIEGLDKLIKELPTSIDTATRDIVEDEKAKAEASLEVIQANNNRIAEIKKTAAANNRELSISEAKIIQDLATNTTHAYVDTLDVSAKEKKKILEAMNGDVSKASEKEAQMWLESLGKQRAAAKEHSELGRKEKERYLEDLGYSLDGEFAQNFLAAWDDINQTTIDGFDNQMATIANKYPELLDVVNLSNGELISSMGEAGIEAMQTNDEIVKYANSAADKLAENADKNAKKIAWTAKESGNAGKKAAQLWNNLVLDEKDGKVRTNAREIVAEATKDINTWNDMRLVLHDANLDSNAKLIVGEAAIANGWWSGMAWEDKAAVLQDEFHQTMYKAIEDSGKWNELSFEEKKAILYSNTPEAMAETMLNLGLWDEYQPEIKDLNADNFGFLQVLNGSEEKLNHWSSIPADVKEILGDNYDLLEKVYGSEQSFARWTSLPDDEKKMLGNNEDVLAKLMTSETKLNQWNELPPEQKMLLADNKDLLDKVFSSTESFNAWKQIPDPIKKMLADNVDLKQKVADGTITVEEYDRVKELTKTLNAKDEASQKIKKVSDDFNDFDKNTPNVITKTLKFVGDFGKGVKKALGLKTGTNYHSGGMALVNDQTGPVYKELVKLPDGRAFLPQERNTLLDLPRGSQVVKASLTKKMIPRYEDGIGGTVESVSTNEPIKKLIEAIDRLTNTLNGGKKQTIGGETSSVDSVQLGATNQQNLEAGTEWMGNLIEGWNNTAPQMYSTEANFIQTYKNQLLAENVPNYIQGVAWTTNLMNGWKYLTPTFLSGVDKLGNDSILNLQSKSPTFYSAGQFLIQSLINGIGSMGTSLNTTMNGVANKMVSGIGKGVNGVVAGVNHVLTQVESEKKLSNWTVPTYAKGTKAHPGGLALVNDQKGNNYEEYIQTPDGQGFIPEGRNVLADLPKGSKVMPATKTKRFKKLYDIPRYEEGIGDFDEIFDLIDDKSVFERIVNEKIKYDGMNGMYLNMTKSAVKLMTDKAYSFVKKIAEEMLVGTGDRAEFMKLVLAQQGKQYVWGAEGPDTFDCSGLIMWALKQIGINFPHYTGAQWNATEHISEKEAVPGDLIYFGPNAHRHVGMYTKPGEMFNASAPNAYGPGNGIGYSGYAAPDLWGFARIKELTGRGGMGSSRGRNFNGNWNNAIRAAAKQMRVQVTESDIANILSLIQHESGGNEKVIQSAGVWDINMANGNPARGLLQYIPSTFANYAVKGHNNIMSGYDQLLAFFNNKYWRTQFNPRGGWSPSGPRRYENGGLITKHGLFEGAEGNKPEMVIPLTRKTRAIELMGQVLAYLSGNSSNNSGTTQKSNDSTKLEDKLDQLIGIMSQFGSDLKNLKLEANERELATVVDHAQTKTALIQSKIRGDG